MGRFTWSLRAFLSLLVVFGTVWTAKGLSCWCSDAFCEDADTCNNTSSSYCVVLTYKHMDHKHKPDGSITLEQFCLDPASVNAILFCPYGTCNIPGAEACYCCTTDYCNTGDYYNARSPNKTVPSTISAVFQTPEPTVVVVESPSSPKTTETATEVGIPIIIVIVLCFSITTMLICIGIIVAAHFMLKLNVKQMPSKISSSPSQGSETHMIDTSSGSGAGLPLLAQRSIALDINLIRQIGRGRYGEVWHGIYHGQDVAVKIFEAHEETSWERETSIYDTCLLQHPNILRFVGADNKDVHVCTQRWLVFEYCELKSLYEYLQTHTLPETTFCMMATGIVSGLNHLHNEVHGKIHKPSIAHRDLKSGNILVRGDMTCCIADLGLALCSTSFKEVRNDPSKAIVGTKRYLAPEILDGTINTKSFQSFIQADIYSLSLLLWEMARRVLSEEKALEYQLPYQDCAPRDPSLDDMREIVCQQGKRPHIPNTWDDCQTLSVISKIIEACWSSNSSAKTRLSALRILKTLQSLAYAKAVSSKALYEPV